VTTKKLTKLLALYLPYLLLGLAATNFGEAWRLAEGKELGDKIMSMMGTIPVAFANPLPNLHPLDFLVGLCCGAGLRLAVYLRGKNAKKYRHGMEYGSARWGTPKDIEPFMAPKFEDNINAVIRDIKKKIALLFDWIAEAKAEIAKPQAPDLVSLLNAYYTQRRAGAYSQKDKVSNLKEMNETFNYLRANGIYSLEDLEHRVSEHSAATESLKKTLDEQTARMKAIKRLYDSSAAFQSLKPVYDGLQKIKFEKPRAKYKAEHETELKQFYAARRKLTGEFPDGKVDMKKLTEEYDELEQAHNTTYGEFKTVRDDLHRLWKVKSCVDTAARFNERTEEQMLQNRPQTRHKKEELSR